MCDPTTARSRGQRRPAPTGRCPVPPTEWPATTGQRCLTPCALPPTRRSRARIRARSRRSPLDGHARRRTARPTGGRATRGDSSAVFTPGTPSHEFGWRIVIHLIPLYETRSDSAASTPRPTPRRRATSHGTEPKTHVADLRRSSAAGNRAVTDRPPSSPGPPARNRRQYWVEAVRRRSRSDAVFPNADRPRAAGSVLALVADTRPRNDTPEVLDIVTCDTSAVRDPFERSRTTRRSSSVGRGPSIRTGSDAPRRGFLVGRRPSRGTSPRTTQAGQYV